MSLATSTAGKGQIATALMLVCLVLLGSASRMIGEFFREGAVLLAIFVPLELWKPQGANFDLIVRVALVSFFVLGVGMLLEWIGLLAIRIKRDLEVNYGSE